MTANYDDAELAKFTTVAHDWWDPQSPSFGALHKINPLRLGWIASHTPLSGLQVLDVGCGGGILADSMARRGAQVLGIDLGEASLHVAQLHALQAQTQGVMYRCISAESLALETSAAYDVVTCMEMLEHVPDPQAIVQACAALVKPGGWVFFSTIHRNARSFFHAIVGAEYLLGLIPRGTHEYAKFIPPAQLLAWARAQGLTAQAAQGLGYNPFSKRYALTQDTRVNYLLATQKNT